MKNKINYRPEIDGLRCLAVVSVILYHYDFSFNGMKFFTGGYIGVDIFYVISGYLITSIILRGLKKNDFSLLHFYERRIRRLLPALIFVIFLILPLAWFKLLPLELEKFFLSISFTSFFISNLYFWNIGEVYGAVSSVYEPLLHTWSLAVEEQFYIFYPFFIFVIFYFLKRQFNLYFLIIFFLSLIFAQYFSVSHPTFNFYMLFGRVWELLAGAFVAKNEQEISRMKIKSHSNFFCGIGIALLIISFFYFDKDTQHPSILTIIPVLSTAILILFLHYNHYFKNILSSKLFVNTGLISYSLYLWHYPLYSFFIRFNYWENNNYTKIVLIAFTFMLAIATYFFIEKPCRSSKKKFKNIAFGIISSLIFLNLLTYIVFKNNGFEGRLKLSNLQKNFINYSSHPENFDITSEIKKQNIIVIGNSHAKDFYQILRLKKDVSKEYNIHLLHIQIKCLEQAIIKRFDYCLNKLDFESQNIFQKQLKKLNNSEIVILKTRWSQSDIDSLSSLIKLKNLRNKRIIIVNSSPEFDFKSNNSYEIEKHNLNLLQQRLLDVSPPLDQFILLNNRVPKKKERVKLENFYYEKLKLNELKMINSSLLELSKVLKLEYYDLFNKICSNELRNCKIINDDKKLFLDDNGHFTKFGKSFVSRKLEDFLK